MGARKNFFLTMFLLVVVLIVGWAVFRYGMKKKVSEPAGTVGAAKQASEAVPEIQTNPAEKVPEINPLDRANPFKYNNPLR